MTVYGCRVKVFSDWLPNYAKDIEPDLEIIKMAAYFPDNTLIVLQER